MGDYQIYFQQTANERYDTDMNQRVRSLIEGAGIPIVEEFGGTALNVPADQLGSECGFVVRSQLATVTTITASITEVLNGRPVEFTEVDQ
jgi:hypothetical protein